VCSIPCFSNLAFLLILHDNDCPRLIRENFSYLARWPSASRYQAAARWRAFIWNGPRPSQAFSLFKTHWLMRRWAGTRLAKQLSALMRLPTLPGLLGYIACPAPPRENTSAFLARNTFSSPKAIFHTMQHIGYRLIFLSSCPTLRPRALFCAPCNEREAASWIPSFADPNRRSARQRINQGRHEAT
jgi:hypothetical protein